MDKLWAPWRITYVRNTMRKGCIFCASSKAAGARTRVFATKHTVVIPNIYPYNNGHLMVAPRRHVKGLESLRDAEMLDLLHSVNKAKKLLDKVLKPHGYNIGINVSRSAGAGIAGHLHIHIVPRWVGDTNFMPVLGKTKVISQSIRELLRQLRNAQSE